MTTVRGTRQALARVLSITALVTVVLTTAGLTTVGLTACTGTRPGTDSPARLTGTLTVLASTSLTEAVSWLGTAFQTTHPGVKVVTRVGADTELVASAATAGAADVLLVEGTAPLSSLARPGSTNAGATNAGSTAVPFAGNQMVLAVAMDNPKRISRLADLSRPGVRVAICDPAQPCGTVTSAALTAAGVRLTSPIVVPDVRAARAAVADGRADAALVYRTDTRAATNQVSTVEFTESVRTVIAYQALVVPTTTSPEAAAAFVAFLKLRSTQDVLTAAGYQPPPSG